MPFCEVNFKIGSSEPRTRSESPARYFSLVARFLNFKPPFAAKDFEQFEIIIALKRLAADFASDPAGIFGNY